MQGLKLRKKKKKQSTNTTQISKKHQRLRTNHFVVGYRPALIASPRPKHDQDLDLNHSLMNPKDKNTRCGQENTAPMRRKTAHQGGHHTHIAEPEEQIFQMHKFLDEISSFSSRRPNRSH
ncbi:hypothetical protein EUTSA_v10010827mg [Eutrema salsugineum]|uniref:Uncharacterized protein n=1 Tax=Eutrema salsugineum TaxID=72664 RepID=V4LTR8_EUTSA|nr:hypothetical protein EUTSA_v10010827mg [Eutrema salsugineum]